MALTVVSADTFAGPGILVTLIVALLVAWSAGQGLAYFGYTRLGRTLDMNEARRVMRFALLGGLTVVFSDSGGTSKFGELFLMPGKERKIVTWPDKVA